MTPQPRYKPGDRIANRYQVHKALMGGMGEVYLCLDLEEMVPYALKTFQQRYLSDSQRLRRAFEQEVATWVALEKHPNIVRCFWMQTFDNQPFMALEWIAGEEGKGSDLRSWLRHGPLDLKLALQIAIDICNGLIYARSKQPGLVHRDLKPENILMAQGGPAKITDFGLAQIVAEAGLALDDVTAATDGRQSLVADRGIVGTPPYMAPEQWCGETLDERTDIYAIGCILYELLTGRCPFVIDFTPATPQQWGQWLAAMQLAHESQAAPRLSAPFTSALDGLVQYCLSKRQSVRPQNLAHLANQLTQLYQKQFGQLPPPRPAPGTFAATDYNNRGNTYHALQRYEEALTDFDRAIILDPNEVRPYSNRGNTYDALQRYEQALTDYDRAVELDPNFALAYSNRGTTYKALHRFEQSLADFDRAIALDPKLVLAYSNRGATYAALQRYEQALADYDRAIALDPDLAQVYFNRGNTYQALGEHAQALADFTQAIELNPNYADAYSNRGTAYQTLRQYSAALADFNHALTLNPNLAQAYSNRGLTNQALGRHVQALDDFNRAIEFEPQAAIAYFNRGTAYVALDQHSQALSDFSRAIEINPNYMQAYANRGNTYDVLGRYPQALADFNCAIELKPNDAQLYSNRANIYQALGRFTQAANDYRHAIKLAPSFAPAYYNLGVIWAKQGQLYEAVSYLEQAVQLGFSPAAQALNQVMLMLSQSSARQSSAAEAAFAAFLEADSPQKVQQTLIHFPLLGESDFMAAIEQIIANEVPSAERPVLTQRLLWLRHIATNQHPRSPQ